MAYTTAFNSRWYQYVSELRSIPRHQRQQFAADAREINEHMFDLRGHLSRALTL
ncbi:hypothetical protein [Bradyrhizobium japonicum]|uniref:hypothetical protein n=1 Tax=Bradyrhizobium japonicum TaxID=375 RepID=UPI000AC40F13|nr:hypothetical protein [Bradyrhizobium japonicum]MBR0908293.1 hypothetical protein [Bradyrhizobium japonicum]MCD9255727.1 hypothetical protein [Bradyrhizobium japonicum SEMIA 5079]MCD9822765.1 hypothetical protein [Bradyrhizobium japonicum]MCD9893542.1 hypothetical protein [Bradyrhizobium japonicum]MCS3975521.1 hypothetical protein [Bradyrhizobium japonicum]